MLLWPRDAPGTTPTAPALPKAGRRRQHSDIFVRPYAHTRIQLASMGEKPLVGRSTPECRPVAVFSASSFLAFCSSCRDTVKSHDHTAKSYDSHRLPQPRLRSNVAGLGGVRCLQPLLGNRDYHNGDPLYAQFRSHPCSCWNSPENILHSGCLRDVRSPPLLLSKMLLWPRDAPGTTPTAPALPKAGRRRQHSDIFVRPYAHTRIQLASMGEKPLVGRSTPNAAQWRFSLRALSWHFAAPVGTR